MVRQSAAILLYSNGDEELPLHLMEQQLPTDAQIEDMYTYLLSSSVEITKLSYVEKEQLCQRFSMNEIQFRIFVQFMEKTRFSMTATETLKEYCRIRKHQYITKLDQLISWMKSSECRRNGIIHYFEENEKVENPVCCDCCGETVEAIQKMLPNEPQQNDSTYSEWKQVLASMLLVKGRHE